MTEEAPKRSSFGMPIAERFEALRVAHGMPADWLDYTVKTAETILRQRVMLDINTRTMTRMATVHSLDLARIKAMDLTLKRAAEFLVKVDGYLPPGTANEIIEAIKKAREP